VGVVTRLWQHLRALWPGWTILAPLPFVAHATWVALSGRFHWENAVMLPVMLALFAVGPRSKRLFLGIYPLGLVGIFYDTMRIVKNLGLTQQSVHLCDLRAYEMAFFGITSGGQRMTPHDWFQIHWSPALDLLCAFPYAAFIFVCFGFAVWLYWRDYPRMLRFAWCFFALNIAGFLTYHLYPAAPPWYFHTHGCLVDLAASASEGPNLARVDGMLGVHYFSGMYGRASDVFGAMPSLHCAYAWIVVMEGWAVFGKAWRAASVGFFVLMVFAAVYLDHHWLLDVVAGIGYGLVVVTAARGIRYVCANRFARGPAILHEPSAPSGAP
jgi:membrane-associated phospholipid phosphatase